jgi:hypothetical protein
LFTGRESSGTTGPPPPNNDHFHDKYLLKLNPSSLTGCTAPLVLSFLIHPV